MQVIFFNGLGKGETRKREQLAFDYLAKRGIEVTHHHTDWLSSEPFEELLDSAIKATKELLQKKGRVALVGSSAGGGMAINVFSRLQDEDITAISLCGRLHPGNYHSGDKRSLEYRAYLNTERASQSFYDSVQYCDATAIPSIKPENLSKIAIIKQLTDRVVPRETMDIQGVEPIIVPGFGHGMGIALAAMKLPGIIGRHE